MQKDLTILVAARNNSVEVHHTLETIFYGVESSKFEVAVLDDSTDNAVEMVSESFIMQGKPLRYIRCEARGLAAAWNFGIENTDGRYIWFLNAGDDSTKRAVERIVSHAVTCHDLLVFQYLVESEAGDFRAFNLPRLLICEEDLIRSVLPSHQAAVFSRSFLESAKLKYDERLSISADSDLFFKVIAACKTIGWIAEPIAVFRLGGMSNRYKSLQHARTHVRELRQTRDLSALRTAWLLLKICVKNPSIIFR